DLLGGGARPAGGGLSARIAGAESGGCITQIAKRAALYAPPFLRGHRRRWVCAVDSPQYRTCSASDCSSVINDWTAASGTIENNDYIQLRLTTSGAGGDTYSATLFVGTGADVWNATPTGDCSGSPAPGTVCPDGTLYAGQTPDGNVKMYVTRCDAGMSWNGITCTGTRSSLPWNDGTNGDWVSVGVYSHVTGEANTTTLAATDAGATAGGFQDHVAAVYCDGLSQDGYTDWYLPA